MWTLEKVEKTADLDEYWILLKDKTPMGAFFNKIVADRIVSFFNNKWIQSK